MCVCWCSKTGWLISTTTTIRVALQLSEGPAEVNTNSVAPVTRTKLQQTSQASKQARPMPKKPFTALSLKKPPGPIPTPPHTIAQSIFTATQLAPEAAGAADRAFAAAGAAVVVLVHTPPSAQL